jgi:hypothetical protein
MSWSLGHGKQDDNFDMDSEGVKVEMAEINKFAEKVIDLAERFADITDAAQGKGHRKGVGARWLVLPAVGAGLYALGTNGSFTRKTKKVMNQAKARASELPDDLMNRVEQASGATENGSKNGPRQTGQKSARSQSRQTRSQSRRKTSSAR